jgi:Zn-dependent protease
MLGMNTILMAMTFVAFLLAMSVHYTTQALVAAMMGDGSPAHNRRLNLNPLRHAEPLGMVVALTAAFPASIGIPPAGIGWGKPIIPDARKLSIGPNAGLIMMALSGIAVNIFIGLGLGIALGFVPPPDHTASLYLSASGFISGGPLQGALSSWEPGWMLRILQFGFVFAYVNVMIGIINIIPLFPLDGYHILFALLPERSAVSYRNNQQMQELILLLLLFLVPFILSFAAGVTFNPIQILRDWSVNLVAHFSGVDIGLAALNI